MALDSPPMPLPTLRGGVNCFTEGEVEQPIEAFDCLNDDGELRRRDAFQTISHSAPFLYPPGRGTVLNSVPAVVTGRRIATNSTIQPLLFYVGCDEVFDGFIWPVVSGGGSAATTNKSIWVDYWNGSAWVACPWILDTTRRFNADTTYHESLAQFGSVHWRRTQMSTWASSALAGVTRYWVRVRLILKSDLTDATVPTAQNAQLAWTMHQPGIIPFRRAAVNGLFSGRLGETRCVLVGSDRTPPRGLEKGAMLAAWYGNTLSPVRLDLVSRFAAGWYDEATWPTAVQQGDAPGTSSVLGTAEYITDSGDSTIWDYRVNGNPGPSIFIGGLVTGEDITPSGSLSTTQIQTTDARVIALQNQDLEGFLIECTLDPAAGVPAGEIQMVTAFSVSGGTATLTIDTFSSAPNTSNRFRVLFPSKRCKVVEVEEDADFAITDNVNAMNFNLQHSLIWDTEPTDWMSAGDQIHFRITDRLKNVVSSGERWIGTHDSITRSWLLINGATPLIFDGQSLRELEADYQSDLAQRLVGDLGPVGPDGYAEDSGRIDPKATLRTRPPPGDYIIDYAGRIVIANKKRIYWSLPHTANNIWPYANEAAIRDAYNDDICGMRLFNDTLILFTPTAIHEAVVVGPNLLALRPISVGLGFAGHYAVDLVPRGENVSLVGINADGIYEFSGGEPRPMLEDWRRIEPNGVNVEQLHKACLVYWRTRNAIVFSYPSRSSMVCNRMGYIDLSRQAIWPFRHSDGISSLTVGPTGSGGDQILIGTEDGFVQTLADAETDDGRTITGYARSRPIKPFGDRDGILHRLTLNMKGLGIGQSIGVRVYIDRRTTASRSGSYPLDVSQSSFDVLTTVFGTARYAQPIYKPVRVNGADRFSEYQFELTGSRRWRYADGEVQLRPIGTARR